MFSTSIYTRIHMCLKGCECMYLFGFRFVDLAVRESVSA